MGSPAMRNPVIFSQRAYDGHFEVAVLARDPVQVPQDEDDRKAPSHFRYITVMVSPNEALARREFEYRTDRHNKRIASRRF